MTNKNPFKITTELPTVDFKLPETHTQLGMARLLLTSLILHNFDDPVRSSVSICLRIIEDIEKTQQEQTPDPESDVGQAKEQHVAQDGTIPERGDSYIGPDGHPLSIWHVKRKYCRATYVFGSTQENIEIKVKIKKLISKQ